MKELEPIEEHKFKKLLRYYDIDQQTLARNLGVTQSYLSNMLSGYRPMTEKIKNEIQELLNYRQFQEKEHTKKSKRKAKNA